MDRIDELVWKIMDNRERGIKLLKKWCAELLEIEE